MPTFDGDNLIMTLDAPTANVLTQDVEVNWYNAWKDWQLESPLNRKYPPVFYDSFGGNNIVSGLDAGAYFIFQNNRGWRIRPYEDDQTIYVTGTIVPGDSTLPIIIPTVGAYTVMFDGLQQQTQVVETGTSGLTAEETAILSALATRTMDLWQFKGCDAANPVTRGGDGVTNETITVDGKVITITPDDITRT